MDKSYRIGIDARLFGTAQAAGIGTYTEELVGNLLKVDPEDHYTVFVTHATAAVFPFYGPNLTKQAVPYRHYTYSEQFFYPRLLKSAKLDLIHYTNFNTPVFFRSIKSIVTIHDLTLWFYPGRKHRSPFKRWLYRYVIAQSCRNAERIIAVSQGTKQDIIKYLNIPADKIDVIYEGVPPRLKTVSTPKRMEMIKSKYNITSPFFLYVGQWRAHKNLERLIRGFAIFRRRYNLDYQLVIVGKQDPLAPEVPATIKQLGLQDAIVTTGYIADSDLADFYNAAEAFVFPSLYEGFGIPPLEAMGQGTPVISSNVSVMPEVLGDAALYFDPLNLEDIAAKLYQFATSFRVRQELKERGLAQARKYSFGRMAKETLAVYQKVLNPPPPPK
ncbi:MAG: glycosyltransferase family 1 protein [Patescibacteria group bacterium]|jgi:glycosyltransferase involved in cell wall biosynthesis